MLYLAAFLLNRTFETWNESVEANSEVGIGNHYLGEKGADQHSDDSCCLVDDDDDGDGTINVSYGT